jgi:hypothetical protein
VGGCGQVLSCQALNVTAFQGSVSSGAYPVLKAPERALGLVDEAEWVDRWQNPARP